MGTTPILLVVRIHRRRRPVQELRTVITLPNLLYNLRRASGLRTEEDQAVGADMVYRQVMDKDQGMMSMGWELYSTNFRRWVLGPGREYSNTHTQ